ncbi:hypothetical protein B0H19DRAFT_1173272 [Mycena capillaripes]|nr:hypothetical protein B0H19DRAFT_1173272 [Mycena capillaripes]
MCSSKRPAPTSPAISPPLTRSSPDATDPALDLEPQTSNIHRALDALTSHLLGPLPGCARLQTFHAFPSTAPPSYGLRAFSNVPPPTHSNWL